MTYWRINSGNNGIRIDFPGVVRRVVFNAGVSGSMAAVETGVDVFSGVENPPPSGDVSPALVVEYVDASGVRHTTSVVDGETSITGVAPLLVQFDASDSRFPTAYAAQGSITDEEAYAYLMGGYRMSYGEGSGTWTYPVGSAYPRDEDTGPPVFTHIYRTAGTHTARLKVRDALGNENTISLSVVVSAAPSATHIPVSAGSWPTRVSGTRYTLDAGGDYRSFGTLDTGGLHNIIFEKVGEGTDPRIATFSPDGRSKFDATEPLEYRTANIRFINIDINHLSGGQRGYDYVGVIGGMLRRYSGGGQTYLWHEGSNNNRGNVRYPRGLFLEDTELRNEGGDGFIMFDDIRSLHVRNCVLRHVVNGESTYLMMRVYGAYHTFRNCLWTMDVNAGSANGLPIGQLAIHGLSPVQVWRDDDRTGPIDGTANNQSYGYVSEKQVVHHCQFYESGSFLTNAVASVGGGNPFGSNLVYPRLGGWEDCVFWPSGDVAITIQTASLRGQYMYWRNIKRNMGAGSDISWNTNPPNSDVGDNTTYHGPYFGETTNTRPVPTAF